MRFAKSQESVDEQQSIRKLESSELINFEPPSPILLFLDEFIRKSHQRGKEEIEEDILKACAIILMKTDTIEGNSQKLRIVYLIRLLHRA